MRRCWFACGVLVTLLLAGILSGCGRAEFAVSGRVLDRATGEPLSDAQVSLGRRGVQSDSDGFFSLPLKGGSHQLQAALPGYLTQAFTATVSAETPLLETDVHLDRRTLRGTLTDARTGSGGRRHGSAGRRRAESGADGAFGVDAVAFGPLRVSAAGYLPAEWPQADVEAFLTVPARPRAMPT